MIMATAIALEAAVQNSSAAISGRKVETREEQIRCFECGKTKPVSEAYKTHEGYVCTGVCLSEYLDRRD